MLRGGAVGRRLQPGVEGNQAMRYTAAKILSKEQFTIDDDAGAPQFQVRRIYGPDGNSLSLRNPEARELAAIKPRTGPTRFEIAQDDHGPITVRHQGWFGRKYSIETPAGDMTATVGDFSAQSYELISAGTARATVTRGPMRQQNLTIDVADGGDAVSLIAIVLAIETIRDDRRQAQDSIPYVRLVLRLIN